ncbi:MAG TPA: thioredoxin-dependent thiol peroxidase [Acidimicrobiia bacterium]|nr:thioredoxin-dependent thiol peroxidase [Acidimicrobiia bacterium]
MLAPSFTLSDQDGKPHSLKDHAGRRVILFFYPKAMTPGCTGEACDFRDSYDDFLAGGYDIVGISPDPPESNRRFRDKHGFPFPLLSDQKHSVAEAYGAWGTKTNYGKEYEGLIRSTFVVGPDQTVEREFRNVRAKGHVDRLRKELLEA